MTNAQREAVEIFAGLLEVSTPAERKEMLDTLQEPYCVACGHEESFGNMCQCDNDE